MPYKDGHPMYIRIQREKALYERAIEVVKAFWGEDKGSYLSEVQPLRDKAKERVLAAIEKELQAVRAKEEPKKRKRSGPAWMRNMPPEGPTVMYEDRFGNHIAIHPKNSLRLSGVYYLESYEETIDECNSRWGFPPFTNYVWYQETLRDDQKQTVYDIGALQEAKWALEEDLRDGSFLDSMQQRVGSLQQKAQRSMESEYAYLIAGCVVTMYHLLARFFLDAEDREWMFPKGLASIKEIMEQGRKFAEQAQAKKKV